MLIETVCEHTHRYAVSSSFFLDCFHFSCFKAGRDFAVSKSEQEMLSILS